jgi:glycerol uptake facilitator-like aquaporin
MMLQVANPPPSGASSHAPAPVSSFISAYEGELSLIIVGLGVVVIIALSVVLRKKESSAEDVVRAYALVLILIGTMVLICAGYSNDQIAPAMGLFGTVAGYLLGRKSQ